MRLWILFPQICANTIHKLTFFSENDAPFVNDFSHFYVLSQKKILVENGTRAKLKRELSANEPPTLEHLYRSLLSVSKGGHDFGKMVG